VAGSVPMTRPATGDVGAPAPSGGVAGTGPSAVASMCSDVIDRL
jgi:hypothetical protein